MSFMQRVEQGLAKIDLSKEKPPSRKVGDGEEVVLLGISGVLELQRLFVLRDRMFERLEKLNKEYRHKEIDLVDAEEDTSHDPATCELCGIRRDLIVASIELKAVDALLVAEIQQTFILTPKVLAELRKASFLLLCEGWDVVAVCIPPKPHLLVLMPP